MFDSFTKEAIRSGVRFEHKHEFAREQRLVRLIVSGAVSVNLLESTSSAQQSQIFPSNGGAEGRGGGGGMGEEEERRRGGGGEG